MIQGIIIKKIPQNYKVNRKLSDDTPIDYIAKYIFKLNEKLYSPLEIHLELRHVANKENNCSAINGLENTNITLNKESEMESIKKEHAKEIDSLKKKISELEAALERERASFFKDKNFSNKTVSNLQNEQSLQVAELIREKDEAMIENSDYFDVFESNVKISEEFLENQSVIYDFFSFLKARL